MQISPNLNHNQSLLNPIQSDESVSIDQREPQTLPQRIANKAKYLFKLIGGAFIYGTAVLVNTTISAICILPIALTATATYGIYKITSFLPEYTPLRIRARSTAFIALILVGIPSVLVCYPRFYVHRLIDKISTFGMRHLESAIAPSLSATQRERLHFSLMTANSFSTTLFNINTYIRDPIVLSRIYTFLQRHLPQNNQNSNTVASFFSSSLAKEDCLDEITISSLEQEVSSLTGSTISPEFLKLSRLTTRLKNKALQNNPFKERLNTVEQKLNQYFEDRKVTTRNIKFFEKSSKNSSLKINNAAIQFPLREPTVPNTNITNNQMLSILDRKSRELDLPLSNDTNFKITQPTFHSLQLKMLKRMVHELEKREDANEEWGVLIDQLNHGAEACNDRLGECIQSAYNYIFPDEQNSISLSFEEKIHKEARKLRDQIFKESWEELISQGSVGDRTSTKAFLHSNLQDKLGLTYKPRGASYTLGQNLLSNTEEKCLEKYTLERIVEHFSQYKDDKYLIPYQEIINYIKSLDEFSKKSNAEIGQMILDEDTYIIKKDAWKAILSSLEVPLFVS